MTNKNESVHFSIAECNVQYELNLVVSWVFQDLLKPLTLCLIVALNKCSSQIKSTNVPELLAEMLLLKSRYN